MSETSQGAALGHRSALRGIAVPDEGWLAPLAVGWRAAGSELVARWRDVGRGGSVVADVLAGLTVAAVALPLNVALARASGLPASAGLIAGAVGGAVAAIFGGASLQVTGPSAALAVMVLALAKSFGLAGVAAATLIIGLVQLVLAGLLAGRSARFVPESVLAGFTTGVGLKILDQQIPELLGFQLLGKDYTFIDMAKMMHEPAWLHHVSWQSVVCGLFVAFLVSASKQVKRFPAAIVGIAIATFVSTYLSWTVERVGALPSRLPWPSLPIVADDRWLDLLIAAVPLALLAAMESLLSARAIDRMSGGKPHDPNLELFGQGLANLAVGTLSGLPVTGAVARSGVNVQSGATTRLASLTHALMLLVAVLFLSSAIGKVPNAALAGLLLVIGVRLVEVGTLVRLVRGEKIEALAFAITAAGTVTGHLMLGLVAGLAIHAVHHHLHRKDDAAVRLRAHDRGRGIRAVLGRGEAGARLPQTALDGPSAHTWLANVRGRSAPRATGYVHPKASVIGQVVLGEHVHVAATASVRADEGTPFFIGPNSNVQDGVVIHALKGKHVYVGGDVWEVYVGEGVSMAHDALVHGPTYIGDHCFIGFKSVVHDAVIGAGSYIGIGAVVVGVEIAEGRYVPHGAIVDTAEAAEALGPVTAAHVEFNEDVVEVNRGLAAAYRSLDRPDRPGIPRSAPVEGIPASWEERWSRATDRDRF